ncbi:hypothetical protein BG004_001390 [Podila humilis]|nr:hypothetical protein BG004_001390 [Podila humilis]
MMSMRPCSTCKKTVYVNEKIDVEGRWYHRPCFKCSAPDCKTSLTLRNFQMAALDDSVLDTLTGRPLKVLVCKDHVPMPKHSINNDSLSVAHVASVPKPSVPGLHRALMGERGSSSSALPSPAVQHGYGHNNNNMSGSSPRSLDAGSHGLIMKSMGIIDPNSAAASSLSSSSSSSDVVDNTNLKTPTSANHSRHTSTSSLTGELTSMPTSTLPKFRNGRFFQASSETTSIISPEEESLRTASESQDPTKDDDSYRTLPVNHGDYDAAEYAYEEPDNKQERIFTTKQGGEIASGGSSGGKQASFLAKEEEQNDSDLEISLVSEEENLNSADNLHLRHAEDNVKVMVPKGEEKKLVDMAFHSKKLLDQQKEVDRGHKVVDDDEWDTPADSENRRETVAGM